MIALHILLNTVNWFCLWPWREADPHSNIIGCLQSTNCSQWKSNASRTLLVLSALFLCWFCGGCQSATTLRGNFVAWLLWLGKCMHCARYTFNVKSALQSFFFFLRLIWVSFLFLTSLCLSSQTGKTSSILHFWVHPGGITVSHICLTVLAIWVQKIKCAFVFESKSERLY